MTAKTNKQSKRKKRKKTSTEIKLEIAQTKRKLTNLKKQLDTRKNAKKTKRK